MATMYSSALLFLSLIFAPAASAQTSQTTNATVYFLPTSVSTIEILNVKEDATTFQYNCAPSSTGEILSFITPSNLWSNNDFTPGQPRPTTTPALTQVQSCDWFTFTQGPSTWAMSFGLPNVTYEGTCTINSQSTGGIGEMGCSSSLSSYGGIVTASGVHGITQDLTTVTAKADASITLSTSASPTTLSTSSSQGMAGGIPRPTAVAQGFGVGSVMGVLAAALAL